MSLNVFPEWRAKSLQEEAEKKQAEWELMYHLYSVVGLTEAEISNMRHCTAEHVKAVIKYIRKEEDK